MLKPGIKTFDSKQKNTKSTETRKPNFPEEIVENTELHKHALNKIMTTQE